MTHLASSNSDIIDISPEKAKVIIATEGSKVPTFELQHYAVDDPSEVKLELDQDGKRFDIECDDKVDNIHFRFEEDEKFILNKTGDAVFTGKVQVDPGTTGNEVVTYQQLEELEEEIEDIRPLERGRFIFSINNLPGHYNIYQPYRPVLQLQLTECMAIQWRSNNPKRLSKKYVECLDKGDIPIEEWTGDKVWVNQLDLMALSINGTQLNLEKS